MDFSVITSVYRNDNPLFVKEAIDSILVNQSLKPSEIVLVVDGPVPDELSQLISSYEEAYPAIFHVIRLEENKGLGNALKLGVENARNELIARMDSDDISLPDRFRKQVDFLSQHPEVSIVGGQMTEFIDTPDNIIGSRVVPLDNASIYQFMKSRCALNHVTVMFRRQEILDVGNYQDWFWNEDYYLWVRMMVHGCKFANIDDVLVNVRSGKDQYSRRGGRKYYESEKGIQQLMLKHGIISWPRYVYNVFGRWCIQIAMPNWLRGLIFRMMFRK